jgi:hypothetical protein
MTTVPGGTIFMPVELERAITVFSRGAGAELTVGYFREGPESRVSITMPRGDRILLAACLALADGSTIQLGPLLPGASRTLHRDVDIEAQLLTEVDLVPVASLEAKAVIARFLSNDPLDLDVAALAAVNGDSQLALVLAHRLSKADMRVVDKVFPAFDGRAADALLEHLRTASARYAILKATSAGTLVWSPTREPFEVQKRELELLAASPVALKEGRAFVLFQVSQDMTVVRDELLDVARTHVADFIDGIVTDPRFAEEKNEHAAAALFAGLGHEADVELAARVEKLDPELAREISGHEMLDSVDPVERGLSRLRKAASAKAAGPR